MSDPMCVHNALVNQFQVRSNGFVIRYLHPAPTRITSTCSILEQTGHWTVTRCALSVSRSRLGRASRLASRVVSPMLARRARGRATPRLSALRSRSLSRAHCSAQSQSKAFAASQSTLGGWGGARTRQRAAVPMTAPHGTTTRPHVLQQRQPPSPAKAVAPPPPPPPRLSPPTWRSTACTSVS